MAAAGELLRVDAARPPEAVAEAVWAAVAPLLR
jgi:hypothetical protein